jgi:hypothetical protein
MNPIVPLLSDLAAQINHEHEECMSCAEEAIELMRRSVEHAYKAGELLLQAKKRICHGAWKPWIKNNLAFSDRTAQNYMRLAKKWPVLQANPQRVAGLSYRQVMQLLAEKTEFPEIFEEPAVVKPTAIREGSEPMSDEEFDWRWAENQRGREMAMRKIACHHERRMRRLKDQMLFSFYKKGVPLPEAESWVNQKLKEWEEARAEVERKRREEEEREEQEWEKQEQSEQDN